MSRRVRLSQTYGPIGTTISDTIDRHVSIASVMILQFADETRVQFPMYSNGKLHNLYIYLDQNSSTSNSILVSRINSLDGNLSITIPATTTGAFRDTTNYDLVNVGDLVNLRITKPGNNTIVPRVYSIDFYSEQNVNLVGTNGVFSSTVVGSQTITNLQGWSDPGGVSTTGRYFCDSNMLIKNLTTNVSTNTRDSNSFLDLIDDFPAITQTGLQITIPAGNTGRFTNTTDIYTRIPGDRFLYRNQASIGTGTITWDGMTCQIVNEDSRVQYQTGANTVNTFSTNNTTFPIIGSFRVGSAILTTDAPAQIEINEKIFIREFKFHINVNTLTSTRTHTFTLRKNSTNTAASIVLTAGLSGIVTATNLNVEINSGDLLNYRLTIGGSGTGASIVRLFSLMAATETFSPDSNIY